MKKFFILILFLGVVLAQTDCYEYVDIAEARLAPPYPNYFGAAGEYIHAADCYYAAGQTSQSDKYYMKAADYYITASAELVTGGDNFQRGKSLELAARSYEKADKLVAAEQYYLEAKEVYESYGYSAEAAMMADELASLTETKKDFDFTVIIGIISLLALFFSLFAIARILMQKQKHKKDFGRLERRIRRDEKKIEAIRVRKSEEFKAPPRTEHKPKVRTMTPKEKMAKKLREKYMPK